jgi:phosphoglycerate dehydrogenase-like enzyme
MVAVLERRPDLQAVLDVTDPEPPPPGSPLLRLTNVIRTPHIAGAIGPERRRLGRGMVEELRRYVRAEPLRWEVTREQVARMAIP